MLPLKAPSTKIILRLSFGIVIVLIISLSAVAIKQISSLNKSITEIVEVANLKIKYASHMREAIRLRWISLNKMVAMNDVFDRDEEIMRFYNTALLYRTARTALIALEMNSGEKILHDKLTALTAPAQVRTMNLLDRIRDGELYDEIKEDLEVALKGQAQVLHFLTKLVQLQDNFSHTAAVKAQTEYKTTIQSIIFICVIVVFFSFLILKYSTEFVSRHNDALLNATRAKSDFLANMSHELRTPLNAIIGYSDLLKEEFEDDNQQKYIGDLDKIFNSGKHLLSLISNILDLSKIEAGKMELALSEISISEAIEEVAAAVQPLMSTNNNEFHVEYGENIGSLNSDATKIRQVLFNLLSNSAKFTKNGLVLLNAVRTQKNNRDQIIFQVIDTGIGITQGQIDKLFQPFSQASAETAQEYGGTGLGLEICKKICQLMDGDIQVQSQPGKGTTFTVTINDQQYPAIEQNSSAA
jgi:signal transduction histidine kinase